MNRSPKRLARKLIVLSLALTGLIISLIALPGLRRSAASSADATRTAMAQPDRQIAGAPFIQGVNASRRSMMRTDFGLARRERGILLPALRARAAAAMTGSPFAPVIAATLSDALQTDNNNSGKADPGDTLMYTVTITNSGSDATGVTYTQDLSQNGGNLTLVPGSVNSSPVAVNDSYPNGVGNTRMSVNAANGVLANDFDPDGTTPTAVPITNGNTTNGGKVTLLADGSFTYDPPVGFTGTDTFTYQATDGSKMDNGTVSITLTERVWYVDSNASVDGDGRSATPFKVITGHLDGAGGGGDVDAANDYIFLYSGSYSVTTLPLESGERLIGQGVNLVVNSQTLVTASTKPTLTGTGTAVTLSTGNTVSGLDVSGTSGITGSSVGALTISTVGATGTNGPAFDVQTAGAISVQFDSLSSSGGGIGVRLTSPTSGTFTVTGTTTVNKTSGTGDGITITGGGATTTFTGAVSVTTFNGKGIVANAAGGITISSNSSMVDATGGAALDLTSQNLGSGWNFNLLKSTNSAAEGIKMQGCIQNLTATTTNIQTPTGNGIDIQSTVAPATLSFGTTTVNKTAAGTGINLVGNGTATVSFGALTLTSGNGSGLVATTSGTVNVSSGTITSTSGPALNLSSVTAGVTLTSASSTNSSATGINLATVAGSVSIGTTTVTNSTGIGINATSNSATLGFGGTTVNGSSGTGIVLGTSGNGNTGTITFGALNIAPDNNARGLQAVDNSNTITVTSGTISTAGSPASSGNPAIEITRGSGTTPLTVSLTSVSANGSSTAGIILTNTNGSFTITGDGGSANNSSGGTIQSTSRSGIELSNVQNVSFDQMNLQSTSRSGVNGTSVTNFTFTNSTINNAGSQNRDACIAFNTTTFTGVQTQNGNNINGTMTITGCTMTNGFLAGVDIECDNGTITNANVSNNTINNPGSGGAGTAGLSFVGKGTASTTGNLDKATINLNNITGAGGAGIQIAYSNSDTSPGATAGIPNDATNIIAITNNGISLDSTGTNAIVVTVMSSNSTSRSRSNFNIQGNGKTAANGGTAPAALGSSSQGTVILLGSNGFTDMTGTVNDNRITSSQTANLGGGNGIGAGTGVGANVSGGWTPTLTLIVTNNVITGTDGNGILLVARSGNVGTTHGIAKFKVASNNVSAPINLGGTARQGISVQAGNASSDDDEVYLNINSNTSAGSNAASGIGVRKQGSVQTVNDFGIYDAAGGPALANCPNPSNTDVQTFINALNPAGNGTDVNGGPGYACDTTMAPASVTPIEQSAGGEFTPSSAATSDAANEVDRNGQLKAHHGEVAPGNDVRQLTMAEAVWMGQQAIHRWQNLGLSAEDMARLNGVTFEVSDLPAGQIADLRGTTIVVDEIAAGYGWYVDQNPYDDSEFDVPVFDRERQTTEYSAAHGKMDLLTVLMRELGSVYLQGKNKTPKKLRPLMNPLLLPGVRRMPTDQWNVSLPSPVGAMQSPAKANVQASASAPAPAAVAQNRQPATAQVEGQRAEAPTAPARTTEYAAAARYAVFRRATNQPAEAGSLRHAVTRPQDVAVMGIHEDSFDSEEMPTLRPAAMTMQKAKGQKTFVPNAVQSGGIVSVGPFNLPANESVTIMFQATIDTPVVPAGTTSVCSQGKVTYSGGPAGGVLTTDPGPPAVNGPTCTTLAQADLAVTKSDSPDPVTTGNNITYTINLINNGPDAAYNVKVTDATPANTTFVSATPPAGWAVTSSPSVGGTGNIVFEKSPAGPVANGGMAQFTVVVQVDPATAGGTVITNNAVATSDTPDGTPANNTGTTTTTAQAQADLALTKSDSPDPVIAGNNITYTINFVNNGPGTAQTVTVTDAVPANTTFVSAVVTTGSGWTIPSPPSVGGTGNVVFSKAS
ncbi:MAG TPA: Ig-like domain-containing protein, partial [Blastocatellia bacterium]|nr:Ig-like domain-containing protein [Blastocatellia bacterium]